MAFLPYPGMTFTHSFGTYLLSACFRLIAVLDAGDRTLKKRCPTTLMEITFSWEKVTAKKHASKYTPGQVVMNHTETGNVEPRG